MDSCNVSDTNLLDDVKRIAVLRALHLGDMLCAVPALRALRAAAPGASITLIGLPWAAEFARHYRGYVDDFMALPGYPGLPEQRFDAPAFHAFLAHARETPFDLAVQLHGSGEITNTLIGTLGARRTAGFARNGAWRPDGGAFMRYPAGHEIHRLLALTSFLGAPSLGDHLEFPLDDEIDVHTRFEAKLGPSPYACIHPGGRSGVRWPPERFAAVARALSDRGLRIVITGSAAEAPLASQVAAAMRAPSTNLAGQTDLTGLAAVMRDARHIICNDTGVAHLAAALRVPAIIISSNTEIGRWAPLDVSLHRTLHQRGDVPPCHPAAHPASHICRAAIEPDDVLAQADDILEQHAVMSEVGR